jgi:EmrB/QacA subfamily drug resistance transporter
MFMTESATLEVGTASKAGVLITTSLVSSLIMLDSNIVAVSLPAIGNSLHATFAQLEWLISAYLLSYAALLLASGSYADLRGRKKAMLAGLVVFATSSAVCGLAPSPLVLNVARAVQGLGGALLLTAALAIISSTFEGAARTRAFAVWGASLGIALTAGPIVGGAITNWFGWRWVFLVNVPLCAGLVIATLFVIRESRDPQARRLDFAGVLTFTPGLFLLVWALIDGNREGWSSFSVLARLIGAALFLFVFVRVELRQERPMLDFRLLKRRCLLGAVFAMIGYGAAAQVMVFYLPLYLQNAYGFAPARAGLAMMPFAIPMVLVPRFASGLSNRFSSSTMLVGGLVITSCGNLLFWWVAGRHMAYEFFVTAMLIAGTGAGILNGETVKAIGAGVPQERAGMASGLASTTRFIGILFGVAGLGAILAKVSRQAFLSGTASTGLDASAVKTLSSLVVSGNLDEMSKIVSPQVLGGIQALAREAFGSGFSSACLLATLVGAIAAILTFIQLHMDDEDDPLTEVARRHAGTCLAVDCRTPL